MPILPVTLVSAAAAVFVNIWLGARIAEFRRDYKVSVGDGGHEPLLRRMRAQANFIENAPFVLILLAALELSGCNRWGLAVIAALFLIARILHAIGMDRAELRRWRMYGMITSTLTSVALAVWAVVCVVQAPA